MILLSIIIPTFNEIKLGYLERNLLALSKIENIEVICVDSYSSDGTAELITRHNAIHLKTPTNIRSKRLNLGIELAKGKVILLNHPRSILELEGVLYLRDHIDKLTWGGFYHKFDQNFIFSNITSWYSNHIRLKVNSIVYLDHCLFFNKEYFQKRGLCLEKEVLPNISIFEDTVLSYKFRAKSPAMLLPFVSSTSSTRFLKNGSIKQVLLNQILKISFYLGLNNSKMNMIYEKDNNLNSFYEDPQVLKV